MTDSTSVPHSSHLIHIAVVGTRGIPDIQGGVETHCEQLYPLLVQRGLQVSLFARSDYSKTQEIYDYRGVRVIPLRHPKRNCYEAFFHTLTCVVKCIRLRPDVIHFHAIGPALLVPLAKLLGFRVVFTHHGADYNRQKWGRIAKFALRLGEQLGTRFADEVIVISKTIAHELAEKCGRQDTHLVFNGVQIPPPLPAATVESVLARFGLHRNNYILALGRLVPEKGFHDLVEAWASTPGLPPLVIAGSSDHASLYANQLNESASAKGVVMTGFVKGETLQSLLAGARLFVLPSYHEGLPIALLEAMSHGLDVVVSDIPANRDVGLPESHYFQTGSLTSLREAIQRRLANEPPRFRDVIEQRYDWEHIADSTIPIYTKALQKGRGNIPDRFEHPQELIHNQHR